MSTSKEAIHAAEKKIEDVLNDLEDSHDIRAFRMQIISERGQYAESYLLSQLEARAFNHEL